MMVVRVKERKKNEGKMKKEKEGDREEGGERGPRKSLEDKNNQSHDTKAGRGAGCPPPQGEACQPATDGANGRGGGASGEGGGEVMAER